MSKTAERKPSGSSTGTQNPAAKNGKSEPKETPRVVIQDRIMQVLSKHKDGVALEQLESEGQLLKKLPQGRYSAVARSEFSTKKDKDGKVTVYPSISDHGFLVGVKHTLGRESMHWTVRMFPKQALEAAKRLEGAKKLTSGEVTKLEEAVKKAGK